MRLSWRILIWVAIGALFVSLLALVAVLSFSATVSGPSMEPTLEDGDRVVINVLRKGDIHRFDVIETELGPASALAVKRVIGMPGDRISVRFAAGVPRVLIRRAGQARAEVVRNPAWPGRVEADLAPCCEATGRSSARPRWAEIPAGHYFVVGDNWGNSDDSRVYGWIRAEAIGGRIDWRIRPLSRMGPLDNEVRLEPAP